MGSMRLLRRIRFGGGFLGLAVSSLLWCTPNGVGAEIVYEDLTPGLSSRYAGLDSLGRPTEFGDEVSLAGTARLVTQFAFEYYGELVESPARTYRIRFYANDGPGVALVPRTLLYDSGAFPIRNTAPTNRAEVRLTIPSIEVPNSFTWTIEFSGLTQLPGDRAEVIVYDPPTIGGVLANGRIGSYTDCWKNDNGVWLTVLGPVPLNFAAQITAVPEILTPTVTVQSNPTAALVRWVGSPYGTYAVQGSNNSADWTELTRQKVDHAGRGSYLHVPSIGVLYPAYRVVRLHVPPPSPQMTVAREAGTGKVNLGWSGDPYLLYQLKWTRDFKTWTYLATVQADGSGFAQYVDTPTANAPTRFYQVWTPW